tara:strand:- start:464 stop:1351 length:888 start_codon:yes stop_codon:yes gene_type:complete
MKKYSNRLKNFSGDKKLNFFQKIIWLIISFINIKVNGKIDKKITVKKFNINKSLITKNDIFKSKSPIRLVCNTFWQSINWLIIKKKLNNNLKILEVGCGDGRYYDLIKKISKIDKINYSGIDIKNNNFRTKKNKFFYLDSAYNVNAYLDKTNFLFTQSAIEHFKYDLLFFKNISNFLNKTNKKFIQLHLFPSESCLYTYLFHGYRHYNFKMISELTKYFNKKHRCLLFCIGSKNINKFTLREVTLNRVFKKTISSLNIKKLKKCVVKDNKISSLKNPSFYCLVILSNIKIKNILK